MSVQLQGVRETRAEKEARKNEAIAYLRKALRPAGQPIRKDTTRFAPRPRSTIYTEIVHVARSGMSRHVRVYVVIDGEIQGITWYVAKATGRPLARKGDHAIVVGGCGFNVGLDVADHLNRILFPGTLLSQGGSSYQQGDTRPFGLIWRDL